MSRHDFASKFEARVAGELDAANVSYTYETYSYEYDEPLRKNRARCADCDSTDLLRTGWYTPDFFLESGVVIETKGRFTAADRRKMLAVKEQHPDLNIVMLFMRDNKIHRNSKTFYSDWCMEHGFDFAIGSPKEEWLHGKKETPPT
jgi:hypothetical protein